MDQIWKETSVYIRPSLHSIISTNSFFSKENKKCFICLISLENEIKEKLDKGLPD